MTHSTKHLQFTIGQNIRQHRTQKKMSLRKLAHLTQISESRLDQFELGKNEICLDELFKVACALGVKASELVEST